MRLSKLSFGCADQAKVVRSHLHQGIGPGNYSWDQEGYQGFARRHPTALGQSGVVCSSTLNMHRAMRRLALLIETTATLSKVANDFDKAIKKIKIK